MAKNSGAKDSGVLKFQWTVANFTGLHARKLYSQVFSIDNNRWRILVFPKGNREDYLSLYLDVADSEALPVGWTRPVSFNLTVVDQLNGTNTITRKTENEFKSEASDWGFTSFMPLSELHDPQKGYIVNDTCIIEAGIDAFGDEDAKPGLYTVIKVARDKDLAEQIGKTRYFDLVDHDIVHCFRFEKQTPFLHFKDEVAKVFGIPVPYQRFWMWAARQNLTYRPYRPLTALEEEKCVGQLGKISNKKDSTQLRLFLEVYLDLDLHPLALPQKTKEDILLFFKVYEPEKENLCYIGKLLVKRSSTPKDILARLKQMADLPPNVEIELFEEIKFELSLMCEPIDKDLTFQSSQLDDGDIICFQKSPLLNSEHRCPDVPSFLQRIKDLKIDPHRASGNAVSSESNVRLLNQSSVEDAMDVPKTEVTDLQDASNSEGCCIEQPKASTLTREHAEVPESPTIELVEFMGMGKVEKTFVPLLEEVCSWHPFLIECQKKRSLLFTQWAFTALGRVLHFLKNTKANDMNVTVCENLQLLWEELETCRFDLSWLEPHVQSALDMKMYLEKAELVKELKDKTIDLQTNTKRLKAKLAIAKLDLEVAQRQLAMAEEGFEERDVNHELGYGNH